MAVVGPDDDAVLRFVLFHYRYDPSRHERRNVMVCAFDDEAEFLAWFSDMQQALLARQAAGAADPKEHLGGVIHAPGAHAEQQAARWGGRPPRTHPRGQPRPLP